MNEILLKILPVIIIFVLGYLLQKIGIFKKQDGDLLLKLVFYVSLPALIILSITKVRLSVEFAFLPFISSTIIIISYFVSFFVAKKLKLKKTTFGVFLVGSMILNIGFTLPFIIAAYGDEGLARISVMDFGNGILVFTFVYYQACKYGNNKKDSKMMIKKFLSAPPVWALIIAISLNLFHIRMPHFASDFLKLIGDLTIPILMLVIGIYFSPKLVKVTSLVLVIFIRMGLGLLLGYILVTIFGLDGLTKTIVLIGSAAPVGYNTLTFSSLENLDKEFAASLVSFSIFIGIFYIPLLIFILS
ncbi:MAG: AEC family transporter [Bacteroidales bacterium]|nr:AEC family transporter [Bacteroidales bacterium]